MVPLLGRWSERRVLVVRVKVSLMVRRTTFNEHANHDSKKRREISGTGS